MRNRNGLPVKIIDLSHPFDSSAPVYPGEEPPVITQESTIEKHGYNEKHLSFCIHAGTHLDVPAHMIEGGRTIDSFDISDFSGKAYCIDVSRLSYDTIDINILSPHKDFIERSDFVILHSGWYRYSWSDSYFTGYPVLSHEAAEWLAGFSLKGIGIDMISIDSVGSTEYRNHKTLFNKDMIIIESLKDTDQIIGEEFLLHAFPLNINGGDGSPVRAVAVLE